MGSDMVDTSSDTQVTIVSIHAPTWGATERAVENPFGHLVSIHAPTWGATFNGARF